MQGLLAAIVNQDGVQRLDWSVKMGHICEANRGLGRGFIDDGGSAQCVKRKGKKRYRPKVLR